MLQRTFVCALRFCRSAGRWLAQERTHLERLFVVYGLFERRRGLLWSPARREGRVRLRYLRRHGAGLGRRGSETRTGRKIRMVIGQRQRSPVEGQVEFPNAGLRIRPTTAGMALRMTRWAFGLLDFHQTYWATTAT